MLTAVLIPLAILVFGASEKLFQIESKGKLVIGCEHHSSPESSAARG